MRLYIPKTFEEACRIVPTIDEERYRKWVEDGAVELVVDNVYEIAGGEAYILYDGTILPSYVKVEPRLVPICGETQQQCRGGVYGWVLEPSRLYILELEYVEVPRNLLPIDASFRSSFHRVGWIGKVSNIDPGFRGRVRVLLTSLPNAPRLVLAVGSRVVQVRFIELEDGETPLGYRGQWRE